MRKLIFTTILAVFTILTSAQNLIETYKKGTVKLVPDIEYARNNNWDKVFDTYYDTIYRKPMGNRKSLKLMPDGSVVVNHAYKNYYTKFTEIIHIGDPADVLYYMTEGSVAVYIEDDDGKEIILTYLNKGEFIGEMGLFVPEPKRSVMVRTRTACQIAEISYQRLEQLFDHDLKDHTKNLLYAIGAQLSQRLLQTSTKVGHLAFFDVTGRIARTLLDLCKEPDAMTHPDGMQIRITRQEILV